MIDRALLGLLADGAFHSGESLGKALGVSRAAVWNHVAALRAAGIEVHAVRGKGYRMPVALDLLDIDCIARAIHQDLRAELDSLELLSVVGSTNDILMGRMRRDGPARMALLAEQQTAGRGRRGRTWLSPFGANLYLSISREFPGGLASIDGLSLAVGVALCEAVAVLGVSGAGLKWPNDLLWRGRKLGGILIEVNGETSGHCSVIIGIGLNVAMANDAGSLIDQAWCDLRAAGYTGNRNTVAVVVLEHLLRTLREFSVAGFAAFVDRWRAFDALHGRAIDVHVGPSCISGVAAGIDTTGALLVETDTGRQRFHGGEISVRGAV